MAPGRLSKFFLSGFGAILALVPGTAFTQTDCEVFVSNATVAVPCPCIPGENGITLGFTLEGEYAPAVFRGTPANHLNDTNSENYKLGKYTSDDTSLTLRRWSLR